MRFSYLRWSHSPNGLSVATKWFSIFCMPVFPLGTWQLLVHPARLIEGKSAPIGVGGIHAGWYMPAKFEEINKVGLDVRGVLLTYIIYWVLLPAIIATPFLLSMLIAIAAHSWPALISENFASLVQLILFLAGLVGIVCAVIWLMRQGKPALNVSVRK